MSVSKLIVSMVAAVLLSAAACGGALFWLMKSHRLGAVLAAPVSPAPAPPQEAKQPVERIIAMEPMVVNLSDDGGQAFLRVTLAVGVGVDEKAKKESEKPVAGADAPMRDVLLDVLGRQQSAALLQPDGKTRLKQSLLTALQQRVPQEKAQNVYVTEFLVQR